MFCAVDECPNNAGFLGLPLCEACAWNVWLTVEDFGSPSRKAAARELIRGRGVEEGERRGAAHEAFPRRAWERSSKPHVKAIVDTLLCGPTVLARSAR